MKDQELATDVSMSQKIARARLQLALLIVSLVSWPSFEILHNHGKL